MVLVLIFCQVFMAVRPLTVLTPVLPPLSPGLQSTNYRLNVHTLNIGLHLGLELKTNTQFPAKFSHKPNISSFYLLSFSNQFLRWNKSQHLLKTKRKNSLSKNYNCRLQ